MNWFTYLFLRKVEKFSSHFAMHTNPSSWQCGKTMASLHRKTISPIKMNEKLKLKFMCWKYFVNVMVLTWLYNDVKNEANYSLMSKKQKMIEIHQWMFKHLSQCLVNIVHSRLFSFAVHGEREQRKWTIFHLIDESVIWIYEDDFFLKWWRFIWEILFFCAKIWFLFSSGAVIHFNHVKMLAP